MYDDKEIKIDIDMSVLDDIKETPSDQNLKKQFKDEDKSRDTREDFESLDEWELSIGAEIMKDIMEFNSSLTDEQNQEFAQFLKIEALQEKVSKSNNIEVAEINPDDFVGFEREYEELVNQITAKKEKAVVVAKKAVEYNVPTKEIPKPFTKVGLEHLDDDYEKMIHELETESNKTPDKKVKPKPVVKPKVLIEKHKVERDKNKGEDTERVVVHQNEVVDLPTELNDLWPARVCVFHPHGEIRWEQRFETVFDEEEVKKELFNFIINEALNKTTGLWHESYFKTRDMFNYKVVYKPLQQIIVIKTLYRRDKASKEAYAATKK